MKSLLKGLMIFVLGLALSGIALAQGTAAGKDSAVAQGSLWINGTIAYMGYNMDMHSAFGEDVPKDSNSIDLDVFLLGVEGYYFPIRRLGLGLVGDYVDARIKPEGSDSIDASLYRFGLGGLFALDNFADSKFYPFVNADAGWVGGRIKYSGIGEELDNDSSDSASTHGWFWTVGLGANYAIRPNLGIIGRVSYDANYLSGDLDFDLTGWNLGGGIVAMF